MTISSLSNSTTAFGNGSTSVFTFPFIAGTAFNLIVTYTNADGLMTVLTPSQYSVIITAPAAGQLWGVGGSVTYPTAGPAIATGTSITIQRIVPLQQLVTTQNQGAYYAVVTEEALDTLCMQVQQVSGRTGAMRGGWNTATYYNYGDIIQDGINGNNTLNYYFNVIPGTSNVWSSDLAAGIWSLGINVQAIAAYATAAADSASAAAASAAAASVSASSSATSATAATTSAAASATSATASASSATAAMTSETSAATQATNAAGSASAAAGSSVTAAASSTTATAQAGLAATYAASASDSADTAIVYAGFSAASAAQSSRSVIGVSSTSNTIGSGAKTFTVGLDLGFAPGQFITVAETSSPANYMHGQVTSYTPDVTTLVMNSLDTNGSGTFTDWTITTAGPQGISGTGLAGTVNSGTANQLAYYAGSGTTLSGNANATMVTGALTLGQAGTAQGSIKLSGSTSGTTTIAAPVAGTGTMTLQAGTDTLVARATTDTLTNKTLTASNNVLGGVTMTLGSDGTGDIYYRNSGGILTRLARGTANQLLHGGASIPAYSAVVEADLSLTDVTTGNVTSTAHGFAPKSPADATKFLNGATTPAYAQVKDSDLAFTDITTNNVSTSKHGFAPKAPNDATKYLDGTGNYSKPASGLQPQMAVFTASDTFTTSANITSNTVFKFTIVGGGGGGGGNSGGVGAAGGGAGATSIYVTSGLTANTGYTVTVGAAGAAGGAGADGGAGGTSSAVIGGTTPTAAGGLGGPGNTTTSSKPGGAGGTASNGTLNITGGYGMDSLMSYLSAGIAGQGGAGGASSFGGGGAGAIAAGGAGIPGQAYGSGGGGCGAGNAAAGGAGKSGVIIVEWLE